MTTFFLITCAVSVIFFAIFLYECSLPRKKSTRVPVVRRAPESQAVDCPVGRRFFVHLEKQMADFVALHGRTAAVLVLACVLVPLTARRKGRTPTRRILNRATPVRRTRAATRSRFRRRSSNSSTRCKSGSSNWRRNLIRGRRKSAPLSSKATAPAHVIGEQSAPASVPAESALATPANNGKPEPFSFADFTWLNGNSRIKEVPFDTKFFTPEIRADVNFTHDFHNPQDDTISGSSEIFRANEFQVTQFGVGGDFHWDNVQARV